MTSPAETLLASGFDARRYLEENLDVAADSPSALSAAAHYLAFGVIEGRRAPIDTTLRVFAAGTAALPRAPDLLRYAAGWLAINHFSQRPSPDRLLRHIDGAPGYRPFLLIGDSHAQTYAAHEGTTDAGFLPLPLQLDAGSARGLANPASRSGYGRHIRLFLQEAAPRLHAAHGLLAFKFGQVDTEFVFDLRRIEQGRLEWREPDFLAYTQQSIDAYVSYVASLRPLLPPGLDPAILSIFPPALGDDALRRGYLNWDITARHSRLSNDDIATRLRQAEFPDLPTRTRLHIEFNHRLAAAAAQAALPFIDDSTPFLENGLLAPCFTACHAGADHHIDRHVPQASQNLAAVLRRLGPTPPPD